MNRMNRSVFGAALLVVYASVAVAISPAYANYSVSLVSPAVPGGSDSFTWEISGSKPAPSRELGTVIFSGCWQARQIASASATDRFGKAIPVKIHSGGPRSNAVEAENFSDRRLPATLMIQFRDTFGSAAGNTDVLLKTGSKGPQTVSVTTSGPTCTEPADAEHIEEASAGELNLVDISASAFVPISSVVNFDASGATLSGVVADVRVFRNGIELPATAVQVLGNRISLTGALSEGPNHLLVLALDSQGKALSAEATLWAGQRTLQVLVVNQGGAVVEGASVSARLSDDLAISTEGVSDIAGVVRFLNLPDWTLLVTATATGNRIANAAVTGSAGAITLQLLGFEPPSAVDNNDFSLGTLGWNIGTAPVTIVPHIEEGGGESSESMNAAGSKLADGLQIQEKIPGTRSTSGSGNFTALAGAHLNADTIVATADTNMDMVVSTSGEGTQRVSRTFNVAAGTSSVLVRFRFITSEVPGGYFGSQYNDSYEVSIRTQSGGGFRADGNSMNGLGLAAFDSSGATAWRQLSLPVSIAGDTVQVDVSVSNVGDGAYDSQVVIDFVAETQLRITTDMAVACPNESVTFRPEGNPSGTITWSGGGSPATGSGNVFTTRFAGPGTFAVTANLTGGSGAATDTRSIRINELSGAAWVARFPTSRLTADLVQPFRGNVNQFIASLVAGGAPPSIAATLRPAERAHLMHYAYRVAQEGLNPADVPSKSGVDICWVHRDASGTLDLAASRAAAQAMVSKYNIKSRPARASRHTIGRAIDMSITWSGDLTLTNASGQAVTITTTPRTGEGNTELHQVGATFGVRKLVSSPPHWSDDGY